MASYICKYISCSELYTHVVRRMCALTLTLTPVCVCTTCYCLPLPHHGSVCTALVGQI